MEAVEAVEVQRDEHPLMQVSRALVMAADGLLQMLARGIGADAERVAFTEEEKEVIAEPLSLVLEKRMGGSASPETILIATAAAVLLPKAAYLIQVYIQNQNRKKSYGGSSYYRAPGKRENDAGDSPTEEGTQKRAPRTRRIRTKRTPEVQPEDSPTAVDSGSGKPESSGGIDR